MYLSLKETSISYDSSRKKIGYKDISLNVDNSTNVLSTDDDDGGGGDHLRSSGENPRKRKMRLSRLVKRESFVAPCSVGGDVLHQKGDQRAVDKKLASRGPDQGMEGMKSGRTNPLLFLSFVSTREVICRISSALFPTPPSPLFAALYSARRGWRLILTDGALRRAIFNIYVATAAKTRDGARDGHVLLHRIDTRIL